MTSNQFDEIKENLSSEDIIDIVTNVLNAHTHYETSEYIIFPTVCHNEDSEQAKMKMYYYKNSHLFHCYTECGETFDIFKLFKKYYELHNIKYNFYNDILYKIVNKENIIEMGQDAFLYKPQRKKYVPRQRHGVLPTYPKNILDVFSKKYPVEWTWENISDETMERFHIRYSILNNQIIIPHYNICGDLVGIRRRALNMYEIDNFGKYAPVYIENKCYSHPLSLNLYGINVNNEAIRKINKVVLFEGEKSVLLYDQYFGHENNISLAVCGSSFNKLQLELLINNFSLTEVIIAFDKDYSKYPSKQAEAYLNKMFKNCRKYQQYANFSFIYDTKGLLKEKQSPIDMGKSVFQKLLIDRVRV